MTHIQKNKKNRQLFFTYSILTNLCQVFLTFRPFSATIPSQEANIKSSFMADSAPKSQFPGMEEEVLQFWQTNQIFEQSITKDAPHGDYVFYDGPPFATGTPHYGHLVGSIIKDVVPRFWTMKGYRVERKWGWDCHGLPIENIIEKDLGFKTKQDIVSYGVDKFNAACRERVLEYAEDWQKTITRLGRWADMTSPYRTMDLPYMESVWSVFKKLYDQGLIYEGYRSMYVCPRCETTLSQSEVSEGYRDIKDLSAIAKFELADDPGTFVLAWTTTPWTLIANVALAVGADIDYVTVELATERFVLAKSRVADLFKDQAITIINELKGSELVGKKYQPVFDYYAQDQALKNHASGWQILAADFVTTEDGTGVVHIAPAFGEDDLNLGKAYELPFIQHLGMDGIIKSEAGDFAGLSVKPIDDHSSTDVAIIKYLAGKKLLFSKAKYEHSYPHCWRCDTPLINYATGSWFVKVTDLKPTALAAAETINWSPAHIKDGRFGQWLTGARDWSISRQRFWASCLPIWKCGSCSKFQVFGSIAELEEASGLKITDLHKDTLDPIELSCSCGGQMKRIPDVLDCWFESGSMPYAQLHYPFENQEKFNQTFPAKFIAEGQDQTRTWFYYLHIIASGLMQKAAFQNVIVNGIVLAEDGKKMSKKLKNYPDPNEILDHYGADALRLYLLASPVMQAENLSFSAKGVEESLRKNIMLLWNIYKFYEPYATELRDECPAEHVLDKWIISLSHQLVNEVTEAMLAYDLPSAVRPITKFIDDFSTWYLRRSRDRFKGAGADKDQALAVTSHTLRTLALVLAPFAPFIAETLWHKLLGHNFAQGSTSVHLQAWPSAGDIDTQVIEDMKLVRQIVELGLAARDKAGIKIRQTLASAQIHNRQLAADYLELIKDELNVLSLTCAGSAGDLSVTLDTVLTPELELLGAERELVRAVNGLRKSAGLTIADRITVYYQSSSDLFARFDAQVITELAEQTLSQSWQAGELAEPSLASTELNLLNQTISLKIIKV